MATYKEEEYYIQLWVRVEVTVVEEVVISHQTLVRDEELKPILWEKQSKAISHFEQLVEEKRETMIKWIQARWKDISTRLQAKEPHSPHCF